MPEKILIVEDDATIRTLLEMALEGAGYRKFESYARGDVAMAAIRREAPDLVLLDLMLPGLDGLAIARRIREDPKLAATRILMLTARTEPEDICRGLEAGADDYVTKPFDRRVLLARVRAVLRRGLPLTEGVAFDGLTLDVAGRVARLEGRQLELTRGEFELLERLVEHRGRILPRPVAERSIDVLITKLRQKLGPWAAHLETVRGVGYRMKE